MSNQNLKMRIYEAISGFEDGNVSFVHLWDVIEHTANAIEEIPYGKVIQLRSIKTRLFIEQGYEEEDCEFKPQLAISLLKEWLASIPD